MFPFQTIWGVDFSGARLAGENIWLAECRLKGADARPELVALNSLESLCGTAERDPALAWLVDAIRGSRSALWAIDFPFGLPVELFAEGFTWPQQLAHVGRHTGRADAFGRDCVAVAQRRGGAMHLFRQCDRAARTPFDCYHYRIIYQTFHGMRDVMTPLWNAPGTAIAPFTSDYFAARYTKRGRVVIEACPSSTLKHLGLPYQNYKQPTGGALVPRRRRTRQTILKTIEKLVDLTPADRRKIMRNPGGDALDAVIAAAGAHLAWRSVDHAAIAGHPRHPREGYVYFA